MKTGRIILVVALVFIIGIFGFFLFFRFSGNGNGEEVGVDSAFLKRVITTSGEYREHLKITNVENYRRHFDISFLGVEDFATASPDSFDLDADETIFVNISFSNKEGLAEGVYVGSLNILSEESSRRLPIILEIESDDVLFDANLALYPSSVLIGDQISAEVRIFDLSQIGVSNVEVEYFIKDFSNEVIFSEKENVVISNQILMTKQVVLPESVKEGDYIFGVVLRYKNSIGTVSGFFRIGEEQVSTISDLFEGNLLFVIVFFLLVIFLSLVFVFYSMYSRDKLLEELKKEYRYELSRQSKLLGKREEVVNRKLKSVTEKKASRKLFKKVARERKKEIDKIHKERVFELKKLRKNKKLNLIKRKINEWKKNGYDTSIFEKKIKTPTIRDIKNQILKWKKRGYNTRIFEKSQ